MEMDFDLKLTDCPEVLRLLKVIETSPFGTYSTCPIYNNDPNSRDLNVNYKS